jgi:hypothetical protein
LQKYNAVKQGRRRYPETKNIRHRRKSRISVSFYSQDYITQGWNQRTNSNVGNLTFPSVYFSFSLSLPKKALRRCFFFLSIVEAPSVLWDCLADCSAGFAVEVAGVSVDSAPVVTVGPGGFGVEVVGV